MSEHLRSILPDLSKAVPVAVVDGQEAAHHKCVCGAKSWWREVRPEVFRIDHTCNPPKPAPEPVLEAPRLAYTDENDL